MPHAPTSLADALRAEIARCGAIPFRDFMERALYDPAHGYYGSGHAQVGRGGDYFTNVSVGPLFGQLLARQFEEMWLRLDAPPAFTIVEQGAHRGDFALDVLGGAPLLSPAFHHAIRYVIVEPFPQAQAAQRRTLGTFATGVSWVSSLAELPSFTGVHFSNELPDAFPVHRVVWRGNEWLERAVDFSDTRFVFVDAPLSNSALRLALARLPAVPPGYETEINLAAPVWIADVAARLDRGYLLAIDYGYPGAEYYRPERSSGTLSAYANHRREPDPLSRPGEIDLTTHVDFTSLAEAAGTAGLDLAGFTDQHHFMVGLGRLHFTGSSTSAPEIRAFKTLMHPNLMGRSFHAIGFAKGVGGAPLIGFQYGGDARRALF
jgi:SAM-dependent MidA family methyltransferase